MISPYQAFPVHRHTFQGTASNLPLDHLDGILHAITDTDITMTFGDSSTKSITGVKAGMDIVLSGETITVTTSADVMIS